MRCLKWSQLLTVLSSFLFFFQPVEAPGQSKVKPGFELGFDLLPYATQIKNDNPDYLIGPGLHVNYNGRFGLVDLVGERKIYNALRSYISLQVGAGVITSLDAYNRTSYVGIGGLGYSYRFREARELELFGNISTSNEFRFEPGLQFSYCLLSKNRSYKTRLLFRSNLMGDLDYVPKMNPLIYKNKPPLKLYFGVGIRISRALL